MNSPTRYKRLTALLLGALALGTVVPLAGPAPDAEARPQPRPAPGGAVVAVEEETRVSADEVAAILGQGGIDTSRVRYGVTRYRVLYRTTDSTGAPTTASQLVVLPRNGERALSTVSWLHGTSVHKDEAASVNPNSADRRAALFFAAGGRAVSAPDYVGLGKGDGLHPYGDPKATVAAAVDGPRAARTVAREHGRELRPEVGISGFSQGGPATMMVGRALAEERADRYFRPGALAPVGGPFDLSTFEAAAANDTVQRSAIYLAYFATAWDRIYGLYDSPAEAFRAPYDQRIERLFDGRHTAADILRELPATSKELFTAEFLDRVREPSGVLKERLRPLDTTCDWRPRVPVRIFHGSRDEDVAPAHAGHCSGRLTENGARHQVVDVGPYDHNTSVKKALPLVLDLFERTSRAG
ncbi:hypothetical protein ABZ714_00685 [Streptomyces sp. NPDC006798]|uniref:alpha/beta hydrolase family protein n=1 Tax=Streptomyces sp. NPDC006798 TaxID=3155462 RepID=UPI0034015E48